MNTIHEASHDTAAPTLRCPRCRQAELQSRPPGWLCRVCGVAYPVIDGTPSLLAEGFDQALRRRYEADARAEKDVAHTVGYRSNRQHRLMAKALGRVLAGLPAGRRILDVGCGHGMLSKPLARHHRVYGVDFAFGMLRLARANGLVTYHADATRLPFTDGQFDVCLCAEVIQHFESGTELAAELARVCRPGGKIVVSTLNSHSLLRRVYRLLTRWAGERQLPKLRSAHALVVTAAGLPLRLQRVAWTHYPFSWMHFGKRAHYIASVLATNVIVVFTRTGV